MPTRTTTEGARAQVVRWRYEQLVDSGFPHPLAAQLGRDARNDLHTLIELAERGCPPALAIRILAPFEREPAA